MIIKSIEIGGKSFKPGDLHKDKFFEEVELASLSAVQKIDDTIGYRHIKRYIPGKQLDLDEQIEIQKVLTALDAKLILEGKSNYIPNTDSKVKQEENEAIYFFLGTYGYYIGDKDGDFIGVVTDTLGNEYKDTAEFHGAMEHYCFIEKSGNVEIFHFTLEGKEKSKNYIMTLYNQGIPDITSEIYGEHIMGIKREGLIELYDLLSGEIIFSSKKNDIEEILEIQRLGENITILYKGLNQKKEECYMITDNKHVTGYMIYSPVKPNIIISEKTFVAITYNPEIERYTLTDSLKNKISGIKFLIDNTGKQYSGGDIPNFPLLIGNNIHIKYNREYTDRQGKHGFIDDDYTTCYSEVLNSSLTHQPQTNSIH